MNYNNIFTTTLNDSYMISQDLFNQLIKQPFAKETTWTIKKLMR